MQIDNPNLSRILCAVDFSHRPRCEIKTERRNRPRIIGLFAAAKAAATSCEDIPAARRIVVLRVV